MPGAGSSELGRHGLVSPPNPCQPQALPSSGTQPFSHPLQCAQKALHHVFSLRLFRTQLSHHLLRSASMPQAPPHPMHFPASGRAVLLERILGSHFISLFPSAPRCTGVSMRPLPLLFIGHLQGPAEDLVPASSQEVVAEYTLRPHEQLMQNKQGLGALPLNSFYCCHKSSLG